MRVRKQKNERKRNWGERKREVGEIGKTSERRYRKGEGERNIRVGGERKVKQRNRGGFQKNRGEIWRVWEQMGGEREGILSECQWLDIAE